MKRISIDEQVVAKLVKAEYNTIPTGNAQLVYGIEGVDGEEFEVAREGTMLPPGKYRVVGKPKADAEHSGPWGSFSDLMVERIGEAETEGFLSIGL